MNVQTPPSRDALVHEIGALLVNDDKVAAQPWDAYALVARFGDGRLQISGFAYEGAQWRLATPGDANLPRKLMALREATREPDKAPWDACVVRIVRETQKIRIEFEYEHPERWDVAPATLDEVAERARPD